MVTTVPSRFLLEFPENLLAKREGQRPVSENRRKAMLADLWKNSTPYLGLKSIP